MQVFNTLGRAPEEFKPRDDGRVGMYVCGPTVQSRPHIGHGRFAVVFDVVRRYLLWRGYEVTYVQNVTDVDDKIIAAAIEQGRDPEEVASEAQSAFSEAFKRLGVLPPSIEPKATDHVPEMIDMIQTLLDASHAYRANGDVYFAVRSYPDYGKLSGRRIDELVAGARVEPGIQKRDPLDFALWKAAKPGEPTWESPWGPGRPGWHIECSAMARKYLGAGFDFHAGGNDLVFPHHENEIAQAEAAGGERFARYWLHNGMVNLGGERMSKSTGHSVDLLEALDEYPALAVRLFYLRTHYRKPLDFSVAALDDAAASLDRLWTFRRRLLGPVSSEADAATVERFIEAVDADFDVAGGLGVLFGAVRRGNRLLDSGDDPGPLVAAYDEMMAVLGLSEPAAGFEDIAALLDAVAHRFGIESGTVPHTIGALLDRRDEARHESDYGTADAVRAVLADLGITVEDTDDGSRWHRA